MWRHINGRNDKESHQNWGDYLFRSQAPARLRRRRLALSEASHRLADALAASPHAVYMRRNRAFEPAVVNGIEDAPSFAVESSLSRALRRACRPVMTTRSHRARLLEASLDEEDRESLQRTGAIALVPLSLDRELDAFLLVGEPIAAFDPERLARALAPASACLRVARDGAPRSGPEPRLNCLHS